MNTPPPPLEERTLFDKSPVWYDPRTAIAKARNGYPLAAVYADEWRNSQIQWVLAGGRRYISSARGDDDGLHLTVWTPGERSAVTEQITIPTADLFAGRFRFGASG